VRSSRARSPRHHLSRGPFVDHHPRRQFHLNLHPSATVADTGAARGRCGTFRPPPARFSAWRPLTRSRPGPARPPPQGLYVVAGRAGNVYTGAVATTLDPGQSYQRRAQAADAGYLRQHHPDQAPRLWQPHNAARTYNYTYLSSSNYLNAYIRNRLAQATVNGVTLETDSYDASSPADRPPGITAHYSAYNTGNILRATALPLPSPARLATSPMTSAACR